MAQRMRDERFRRDQEAGIRLPHIAPLNALVDELREEAKGLVPYLDPAYGGVEAELLSVFRDPGPMINPANPTRGGSGFLSVDNDDPAAKRYASLLAEAGIPVSRTVSWNAYPWYINRKPTVRELALGARALRRLLQLLPRLRVLLLHGGEAKAMWRKFGEQDRDTAASYVVLETYHTANQAFIGTKDVRDARMAQLRETFATAARILG